jgi:Tfp pilus assembly PilM family ATPase
MNKKALGLDIGATSIKLVMLDGNKGAFMLKAASISPIPAKGMMSESPLDEEEMAQSIAKAVKDAGVDTKLVNVALPENRFCRTESWPLPSTGKQSNTFLFRSPILPLCGMLLRGPLTRLKAIRCKF